MKLKKLPKFASGEDVRCFVAEADLTKYDLSKFHLVREVVEEAKRQSRLVAANPDPDEEAFLDAVLADLLDEE